MESIQLMNVISGHPSSFHPVVPLDPRSDRLYKFDFTDQNSELSSNQIADTEQFATYIRNTLSRSGCKYGIGGYNEHRTLYARSKHFDGSPASRNTSADLSNTDEPRRLHLGIDIWGPEGTKVMSPIDGIVHSLAFNNQPSDYGATIIITHRFENTSFHTLYGHLSLNSLKNLDQGSRIKKGEVFAEFGMRFENGGWPPHLHFQVIQDMQGRVGDYPGVVRFSERDQWLANCPDPDLILQMNRYIA